MQASDALCSIDPDLGATVHRFALAARRCSCGELDLPLPEEDYYRRTMVHSTKPRRSGEETHGTQSDTAPQEASIDWLAEDS